MPSTQSRQKELKTGIVGYDVTIPVFASIVMTGMKLVVSEEMNYRNTSIVGLSAALATFPQWFQTIFGQSPVVIATVVAVALNIMLPKREY